MSLEAILLKIEKDAEDKARAIMEAAEKERDSALDEHASRLEGDFQRQSDRIRARIDESMRKREYHVRKEATRKLLNARRSMMDRAIVLAVADLAGSDDGKYLKMISSLLEGCDLKGDVEVVISEADSSRITPDFLRKHSGNGKKFVLSSERHGEDGGVIFKSGKIRQNGTFRMIAELAHEEIVMKLSEIVPMEKL